ncbi:hypothetical protein NMY22_g19170 [Coprinellus aureogranulatus]|nr:hypothetical protein NMY22_g19170 [Coprinellus aureogranulatus]
MIHARHDQPSEVRRRAQMFDKLDSALRTHPNPSGDDLALLAHHLSQDYEVYDPLQRTLDALDVSLIPLVYPAKWSDALPQQVGDAADALMQLASIFRAINRCHKPETEALHLYRNRAYTIVIRRWSEIARWMLYIISCGVTVTEEGVVCCISALRMVCTQAPRSVFQEELLSQAITVNVVFLLLHLQDRNETYRYWDRSILPTEAGVLAALLQHYCTSEVGLSSMTARLSVVSKKTRRALMEVILVRARETVVLCETKNVLGMANSVSCIIDAIKLMIKERALCKTLRGQNFLVKLTRILCRLSEQAAAGAGFPLVDDPWHRISGAVIDVTRMAFSVFAPRPSRHIAKLIGAGLMACASRCLPFATVASRNLVVDVLRSLLPYLYSATASLPERTAVEFATSLHGAAPLPQDALAAQSACAFSLRESTIALSGGRPRTCSPGRVNEDWRNLHSKECLALAKEYSAAKLDGSWCSAAMKENYLRLLLHFANNTLPPARNSMLLRSGIPGECASIVSRINAVWTWDASHSDELAIKVGVIFPPSEEGAWKERVEKMSLLVQHDPQVVLAEAFFRLNNSIAVSTLAALRYSPDAAAYHKYSVVGSVFQYGNWLPELYPRWHDFSNIVNATRNAPTTELCIVRIESASWGTQIGVVAASSGPFNHGFATGPLIMAQATQETLVPTFFKQTTHTMVLPVIGTVLLATGAAVVVVPVVAPLVLGAVGFSSTGVVAGSLAAGAQSYLYGAWTTGVFSALQAAGATAALPAAGQIVAGAGAMAAGAVALVL